ncbi:MAG: helix-turn-helix transcriptional regulator, partial [Oscillospiraceae bacterium]|nr:helix-turn-helix transcriptional regulator [Oscillospiraceae bacterium]
MNYELGKKIRLLRLSNNMTQEQLAEKLNVTPQSVSKWENNITAPDIQLLPEISVIFGVTIDELFSITEESKLERIENLFLNSSDITVISDKDFESYRTFLVENIDNSKIKNRV